MYLAITHFIVSKTISPPELASMFEGSAARYGAVPGLLSKHYYVDDTGGAGGVYLWQNKQHADAFFDDTFNETIRQRFGSLPTIKAMQCPLSLDNVHHTQLRD